MEIKFLQILSKLSFALIIFANIIPPSLSNSISNSIDENVNELDHGLDFEERFSKIKENYKLNQFQPRQVHISYANVPEEMYVTWSTIQKPKSSYVEYGVNSFAESTASATTTEYKEEGPMGLIQYIHRAKLLNLVPNQKYVYHVGGGDGWSEIFSFTAMKSGADWTPSFAIYGDLGNENSQSLVRLQRETQLGLYDAIIHVGDFAYDMNSQDGIVGDLFMDQIQPISAYVPYMTCPGNHESFMNFSQYKHRFTMPMQDYESIFYSWNIGPIHFISFSTEVYYFLQFGIKPLIAQYEWLEEDLKEASKPENRKVRPWIITYAHRPMYCTNHNSDDCRSMYDRVRVGVPFFQWFGLEALFTKYGVDMSIWAHEHSYERMWPVYDYKVYNGSYSEPYTNPQAITHITTGSAGCKERHDDFIDEKPEWTAFRSTDYGYSKLKVINNTHLYFEQVSIDKDGEIIDNFHLIRDNHESYTNYLT